MEEDFNLSGKTVLVTGATSGIGLATAVKFAQEGAYVIGAGRSEKRIQEAKDSILHIKADAKIEFLKADLGYQHQVINLGENAQKQLANWGINHLDILINNAGLYLEHKRSNDKNIEMTFAVNHLASFVLTYQLLPWLAKSSQGRVITMSSYAHRTVPINLKRISNPWPYIGLLAYKRSKLCNILFTSELNRRYQNIEAFAVDPGLVNTGIGSKSDPGISDLVWRFHRKSGTDTSIPVKTLLLLSDPKKSSLSNGNYYRDCLPQSPSRAARKENLARELWELSSQLTGIYWG